MTVENTNPIQHFTANGETTVFAISFAVEGKDNIKVTVNGSVVSVNDYIYDALTKAVVFNAAPEDGAEVVVERVTSLDRSINYQTYDNSFRPETLNYDLDRIWRVLQEQNIVDAEILARLKDEIDWRIAHDNQVLANIDNEADQRRLVDERIREEIGQEVEARRTHDLNYDTLAQVRDLQVFGALKQYLDTIVASTNPNIFGGVTAGVVFALDKKSVQTHLEEVYEQLLQNRLEIEPKANQDYVDQKLITKANAEDVYQKAETLNTTEISNLLIEKADLDYVDQALTGFTNGAAKFYPTLNQANADIANIALKDKVEVGEAENGGVYYKATEQDTTLTKSAYDPALKAKEYVEAKGLTTIVSYGEEILTEQGTVTNASSTIYSRSGLIGVDSTQVLKLTSQAYSTKEVVMFYDFHKNRINIELPASDYAGIFSRYISVPENARYLRVMSANSSRPGYIPYNFSLTVYRKENVNLTTELTLDYEQLNKIGNKGSTLTSASLYKYVIIPVIGGLTIEYNEVRTSNVPAVVVYDKNFNVIEEHIETRKIFKLAENATYVLVQAFAKDHASYNDEWASKMYFKRGYADLNIRNDVRESITNLSNELEILKLGNVLTVKNAGFTEPGSAETYNRTPKIQTYGLRKLYVRGLVSNQGVVIRVYNSQGVMQNFFTGLPNTLNRYNTIIELPANTVAIDVNLMNSTHTSYSPPYERLAVLGRTEADILNELNKIADSSKKTDFYSKNIHAFTSSTTYDSVRIPFYPTMQLKYSVGASGGAGLIVYEDGTQEKIYENTRTLKFESFGTVILSTYNSKHASFNADFVASYQTLADKEENSEIVPQFISGTYLPTPTLKAVREVTFKDGSNKTAIQYLWHDNEGNFFVSSTLRGDKKFIFKFESQNFYDSEPHHFSMSFDKFGNIVCVFRIEHLNLSGNTDSVRKNPIILIKEEKYKPIVVNLGEGLKPSGWLQNCGFLCTDEYIMLTEYTRPSVATANTWKATYPLTEAANWKAVQSFELSPEVNPTDNMKHIHNVDRDPFTGYIYTSTGDNNAGAAIFMSKDSGETFTTILSGSEKYCRVLNWVFTKDWIYWATDSNGGYHWFFKAPRNSLGEMDTQNITDVLRFPNESWATYATIYMPKINALVFLGRADGPASELPVDVYDLKNERFLKIDTLRPVDNIPASLGFRCECFEWIPRGNEIACGFSRTLGPGGYENRIGILGNTSDVTKKVNNLILTIDRCGDDFTISYDTVVL